MYYLHALHKSKLEGILKKEFPKNKCTIQDGFISNGKDWLGDKPRANYALVIFEIIYDENVEDLFHLGSAVFVNDGKDWRLQHYQIDVKMNI